MKDESSHRYFTRLISQHAKPGKDRTKAKQKPKGKKK